MDELFELYKAGQLPYMPAYWQSLLGVGYVGEMFGICFFETHHLVIDKEEIPDGVRYTKREELIFDLQMQEATKRLKQKKRS